jgi:hypothetical protein
MPFTAIYGLPGRGKSLLMLQYGLHLAEKYQLRLVTNFCLDPLNLAYYCKINNYLWLWKNLPKGIIYYVSANKNFAQFLQIKQAVILLDEMGLYAPSAQHWTLPAEAFNAVANNRKRAQHIIYAAQYPSQVHSSIHQVCSDIIYAEGVAIWDEKLKNDRLLFKDVHLFGPSEFEVWFRDPKIRKNPIKVWVLARKQWKGVINAVDAQTFRCFDSFGLLEEQDLHTSKFAGANCMDFTYYAHALFPGTGEELSPNDPEFDGWNFEQFEQGLNNFYTSERFKKKRIYEANNMNPFIVWKLCGEIGFPGPHRFQKQLFYLWQLLPAASYQGLKRLDLRVTHELSVWFKLDSKTKQDYKLLFATILGFVVWVFLLFLLPKNIFIFVLMTFLFFYIPIKKYAY